MFSHSTNRHNSFTGTLHVGTGNEAKRLHAVDKLYRFTPMKKPGWPNSGYILCVDRTYCKYSTKINACPRVLVPSWMSCWQRRTRTRFLTWNKVLNLRTARNESGVQMDPHNRTKLDSIVQKSEIIKLMLLLPTAFPSFVKSFLKQIKNIIIQFLTVCFIYSCLV